MNLILSHGPYFLALAIICVAFFGIIINGNYFKKLLCLAFLQTGVIIFFITLGKINAARIPVLECFDIKKCGNIVDPIPQVLMLTAIVVGVATTSVGLSILIQIKKKFGTIEEANLIKITTSPTSSSSLCCGSSANNSSKRS